MRSDDRTLAQVKPLAPHNVARPDTMQTHDRAGRKVTTVAKPHGPGFTAHLRVTPGVWLRAEGMTREEALAQLDQRIAELRRLLP